MDAAAAPAATCEVSEVSLVAQRALLLTTVAVPPLPPPPPPPLAPALGSPSATHPTTTTTATAYVPACEAEATRDGNGSNGGGASAEGSSSGGGGGGGRTDGAVASDALARGNVAPDAACFAADVAGHSVLLVGTTDGVLVAYRGLDRRNPTAVAVGLGTIASVTVAPLAFVRGGHGTKTGGPEEWAGFGAGAAPPAPAPRVAYVLAAEGVCHILSLSRAVLPRSDSLGAGGRGVLGPVGMSPPRGSELPGVPGGLYAAAAAARWQPLVSLACPVNASCMWVGRAPFGGGGAVGTTAGTQAAGGVTGDTSVGAAPGAGTDAGTGARAGTDAAASAAGCESEGVVVVVGTADGTVHALRLVASPSEAHRSADTASIGGDRGRRDDGDEGVGAGDGDGDGALSFRLMPLWQVAVRTAVRSVSFCRGVRTRAAAADGAGAMAGSGAGVVLVGEAQGASFSSIDTEGRRTVHGLPVDDDWRRLPWAGGGERVDRHTGRPVEGAATAGVGPHMGLAHGHVVAPLVANDDAARQDGFAVVLGDLSAPCDDAGGDGRDRGACSCGSHGNGNARAFAVVTDRGHLSWWRWIEPAAAGAASDGSASSGATDGESCRLVWHTHLAAQPVRLCRVGALAASGAAAGGDGGTDEAPCCCSSVLMVACRDGLVVAAAPSGDCVRFDLGQPVRTFAASAVRSTHGEGAAGDGDGDGGPVGADGNADDGAGTVHMAFVAAEQQVLAFSDGAALTARLRVGGGGGAVHRELAKAGLAQAAQAIAAAPASADDGTAGRPQAVTLRHAVRAAIAARSRRQLLAQYAATLKDRHEQGSLEPGASPARV